MFGNKKNGSQDCVSIDVPAFTKQLVDSLIGALCEKFVTRADVESMVLDAVKKVMECKAAEKNEDQPAEEPSKPEVKRNTPKDVAAIIPRRIVK